MAAANLKITETVNRTTLKEVKSSPKAKTLQEANVSQTTIFRVTDEIFYPQLIRLRDDFGLVVMHTTTNKGATEEQYFLSDKKTPAKQASTNKNTALTPIFNSLSGLENYCEENILDLLHRYLCA